MKYSDGFECDKKAKQQLKSLIENNWFSSCTIVYDKENDNNPKARIDVIFTAITKSNKEYKYAIEIKDRMGYNHNQYDWMIEPHKYKTLQSYQYDSGYTSAYFNTFKDNIYALWTFKDMEQCKYEDSVYATKTTQGNDTVKYNKQSYLLPFNNATLTGYTI